MSLTDEQRLQWSLAFMRWTVALVLLVWTLDKFLNPGHAIKVYEHYYFLPGMSPVVIALIGAAELALIAAFVAGLWKRLTYGLVLAIHGVSTLSSFSAYLDPYEGAHILFFAAWPMLAACVALYLLRERDTLGTSGR